MVLRKSFNRSKMCFFIIKEYKKHRTPIGFMLFFDYQKDILKRVEYDSDKISYSYTDEICSLETHKLNFGHGYYNTINVTLFFNSKNLFSRLI